MSARGARHAAKEAGLTRYFTGEPCPNGHVAERHAVNGRCCECAAAWKAENKEKRQAADRAWAGKNRERRREQERARYRVNPEPLRAKSREYIANHREERRAYSREYLVRPGVAERRKSYRAAYVRLPRVVERRRELTRKRLAEDKHYALNQRMRCRMYILLQRRGLDKARRSWNELVGYTVSDLRSHLERQFKRGMGWHNFGDWHIDHVVPLASFSFSSVEDPEFKAAWALNNLRPLWAPANISKGAKREHLL